MIVKWWTKKKIIRRKAESIEKIIFIAWILGNAFIIWNNYRRRLPFFKIILRIKLTIKAFFSCIVWNLPWPNFEDVSINFKLIFSNAERLVCTNSDCKESRHKIINFHSAKLSFLNVNCLISPIISIITEFFIIIKRL